MGVWSWLEDLGMGGRGPSKTPKEILKLHGSWRANVRGDEPQAEKAPPTMRCPSWLQAEAKRAWKKIVKQMGIMGILTYADENLVSRYCETWARWRRANEFIIEKGEGYPVMRDGKIVSVHKFPQTVVASQLLSELIKMEDRMGLSPGARASLAIENTGRVKNESPEKAAFFQVG